jgi:hypothetical protein
MISSFINRCRLSNLLANQNTINIFRYANVNASSSSRTDGEVKLNDILKKRFPNARLVDVKDTSCKYMIYFSKNYTRKSSWYFHKS